MNESLSSMPTDKQIGGKEVENNVENMSKSATMSKSLNKPPVSSTSPLSPRKKNQNPLQKSDILNTVFAAEGKEEKDKDKGSKSVQSNIDTKNESASTSSKNSIKEEESQKKKEKGNRAPNTMVGTKKEEEASKGNDEEKGRSSTTSTMSTTEDNAEKKKKRSYSYKKKKNNIYSDKKDGGNGTEMENSLSKNEKELKEPKDVKEPLPIASSSTSKRNSSQSEPQSETTDIKQDHNSKRKKSNRTRNKRNNNGADTHKGPDSEEVIVDVESDNKSKEKDEKTDGENQKPMEAKQGNNKSKGKGQAKSKAKATATATAKDNIEKVKEKKDEVGQEAGKLKEKKKQEGKDKDNANDKGSKMVEDNKQKKSDTLPLPPKNDKILSSSSLSTANFPIPPDSSGTSRRKKKKQPRNGATTPPEDLSPTIGKEEHQQNSKMKEKPTKEEKEIGNSKATQNNKNSNPPNTPQQTITITSSQNKQKVKKSTPPILSTTITTPASSTFGATTSSSSTSKTQKGGGEKGMNSNSINNAIYGSGNSSSNKKSNNANNRRNTNGNEGNSSIVSVNRDQTIMKEGSFYYDHIMIPSKFEGWIKNSIEQCNFILAEVKAKSNARSIVIEQAVGESETEYRFTVTANQKDACKKAIALLEFHLKNQEMMIRKKDYLSKIQNDISAVQGEVAAGLRIEFTIDSNLTGLAIGKKGEYINKVRTVTGVDTIDVNNGNIRIAGPSIDSVNHAKSMMEIISVDFPLQRQQVAPVLLRHLNDIKINSECLQVRLMGLSENSQRFSIEELQNSSASSTEEVAMVRLIGTKAQVESAKLLLETQLDYIQQFAEMRMNESKAKRRLQEVEVGEQSRNRNGGKR